MSSLLLRKITLYALYVLLLYCDVIVLSQRLRLYDTFGSDIRSTHGRSDATRNLSDLLSALDGGTRSHQIYRKKISEDSQYVHGLSYAQHKKLGLASEPHARYRSYRYNAVNAPSVPSWRVTPKANEQLRGSITAAEVAHSYFRTTQKPRMNFESYYWSNRSSSNNRVKPTIRVQSVVNSTFGQARIETGLRLQNICCRNETDSSADSRGKFRFYNSFSRERGYLPYGAVQVATSSTAKSTTERPTYKWRGQYDSLRSNDVSREKTPSLGLSSSRRIVGDRGGGSADWATATKRPSRIYTTTWVPRTTKDRIESPALNSLWSTYRNSKLNVEPNNPSGLPRSGFDGARGIRPWDDRSFSTPITSNTQRPSTFSGASIDEYDYYDELEKRSTSTTSKRHISVYRRTTERPPITLPAAVVRPNPYDRWNTPPSKTTVAPSPFIRYPPGPIYKSFDDDTDFKEWKNSVEKRVQNLRKPPSRARTPSSSMRLAGSPSLDNDLVALFKVSGIEEEDWRFVHETDNLESSDSKPKLEEKYQSLRLGNNLNSDWASDRLSVNDFDSFDSSKRRTTRKIFLATTSTTPSPSTTTTATMTRIPPSFAREVTQPPSSLFTAPVSNFTEPYVPLTRRFVSRKPTSVRRRTTPRGMNGPRYRFRLYTADESTTVSIPIIEDDTPAKLHTTEADAERGSFANPTRVAPSSTVARQITIPITESQTTPSTTEIRTTPRTTTPETTPSRAITTTRATTMRASSRPSLTWHSHRQSYTRPEVRKPVFAEGMSIDEQLAEAMRRLREKQEENRKSQNFVLFEGSGDSEEENMIADAPSMVTWGAGLANLNVHGNVEGKKTEKQNVRKRISEERRAKERTSDERESSQLLDELVDEHIMKVHSP